MTNQAHLFGRLSIRRSDDRAAPDTNDRKRTGLSTLRIAVVLRIETFIQLNLPE